MNLLLHDDWIKIAKVSLLFSVFFFLGCAEPSTYPYVRWKCSLQHRHGHGFLRYLVGRWQGGGEDRGGDGVGRVIFIGFQMRLAINGL